MSLPSIRGYESSKEWNSVVHRRLAVSCRLLRLKFAAIVIPADKAETEALQAGENLNAQRCGFSAVIT